MSGSRYNLLMDTPITDNTPPSEDGGWWIIPAIGACLGGLIATGGGLLGSALGGFIGAVVSSAILLWGIESKVDIAEAHGVVVAADNIAEYESGTRFLAGLLFFIAVFIPPVQPWYVGIGLVMRLVVWPLLLQD